MIIIFMSTMGIAQSSGQLLVEYQQRLHLQKSNPPQWSNFTLYAQPEQALYLEEFQKKNIRKDSLTTGTHYIQFPQDKQQPVFVYTHAQKGKFYNSIVQGKYTYLVNQSPWLVHWKSENEQKEILGYTCEKVKGFFRGRTYIGWYTPKIPLPYGPWKFSGTQGILLEVHDTDTLFHAVATKIAFPTSEQFPLADLVRRFNTDNAISMATYHHKIDSLNNALLMKINQQLPEGFKPFKRASQCDDCGEDLEIFN